MKRKADSTSTYIIYAVSSVAIILVIASLLAVNSSFENKEDAYLARIPNRVSSKDLVNELRQIESDVRYFKSSENKLVEYPEHFNRHFTLIPYKESFGANISYIPPSSCLVFTSKLGYNDALNIIEDITKLGFGGGYIVDKETIARDLGGNSYKFYSFSKDNFRLTVNNTDSKYSLPARACLKEK